MGIIIAERPEANNRPIIATYGLRISASVYICRLQTLGAEIGRDLGKSTYTQVYQVRLTTAPRLIEFI